MTSLTEVYDGGVGRVVGRRQRVFGVALLTVGVAMVVGSIPLVTTDLASWLGLEVFAARELAGVFAGLGLPAVFIGIFVVLPAGNATRAAAAIGASIAVLGVTLFAHAYPYQWISNDPQLTLATTVLYSLGTLLTFWCLFVGVASFKSRQDPGGTARIEITEEGQVRIVSADHDVPGPGGVGLFGSEPRDETPAGDATSSRAEIMTPEPTSDGGDAVTDSGGAPAQPVEPATVRGQPDQYCGNCSQFAYVRVDGELTPYCGLRGDLMDDMDACEEWTANS